MGADPLQELLCLCAPEPVMRLGAQGLGCHQGGLQGVICSWDPQGPLPSPGWEIFPLGLPSL